MLTQCLQHHQGCPETPKSADVICEWPLTVFKYSFIVKALLLVSRCFQQGEGPSWSLRSPVDNSNKCPVSDPQVMMTGWWRGMKQSVDRPCFIVPNYI